MEVVAAREEVDNVPLQKTEMDLSYGGNNESQESGVFSNNSVASTGASASASTSSSSSAIASVNSSWEQFQNEIADPNVFDPPLRNSSGLSDKRRDCNISTIDGSLASSFIGKCS